MIHSCEIEITSDWKWRICLELIQRTTNSTGGRENWTPWKFGRVHFFILWLRCALRVISFICLQLWMVGKSYQNPYFLYLKKKKNLFLKVFRQFNSQISYRGCWCFFTPKKSPCVFFPLQLDIRYIEDPHNCKERAFRSQCSASLPNTAATHFPLGLWVCCLSLFHAQ